MAAGWLKQRKRYRQYKARVERLPASYRTAIDALQRYSYYFGHGTADGGLSTRRSP
jgi:DNA-binding ferritin-like protein (Dps family)